MTSEYVVLVKRLIGYSFVLARIVKIAIRFSTTDIGNNGILVKIL